MKKWPPLKKGDIIDLVAPGSACTQKELKDSLKILKQMGYVPRVPKNFFSGHLLFSNSDTQRFEVLKKALYAKDSRGIWCVRGGYGSLRLLPLLSRLKKPTHSKFVLGYSDITTIHHFLNTRWGWPTLHGPLFDRLGNGKMSKTQVRELENILTGKNKKIQFKNVKSLKASVSLKKDLSAVICGGNLTVIHSTLGTPWQFSARGKILFLEDIGERPHRVDRMLVQMAQAGVFKGCRAIVLGDFLIEKKDRLLLWNDVFPRFARELKIPVFKGLPVGHGKIQKTLPLGGKATLKKESSQKYQLVVPTGVQ